MLNKTGKTIMFKLLKRLANNDNQGDISFVDVKELYDAAYAEKAKARVNLKRFKVLLSKATQLDEAYRVQLGLMQQARYGEVA